MASTNKGHSKPKAMLGSYNAVTMGAQTYIDQITERVERLLLRHEELLRANAILSEQVRELSHERDGLRQRLQTARQRLDGLLAQMPQDRMGGES
jgi:cell division protein ZapB